jgi:hypothetical protein
LLASLALAALGIGACSSDDPYLVAKAEREKALASIDAAKAGDMQVDTQIKKDKWGLEKTEEQAKVDAAVAALQSQTNLQRAQTDAEINRLQIIADVQRAYAPQEKEAELQRQWLVFWIVAGVAVVIGIDRYRIVRGRLITGVENKIHLLNSQLEAANLDITQRKTEATRYAEMLRQELSQIRKTQQEFRQLRADLTSLEERLFQTRADTQVAEETLRQTHIQIGRAEEKLRGLNNQIIVAQKRVALVASPSSHAGTQSPSGNGNGNTAGTELDKSGLPIAL